MKKEVKILDKYMVEYNETQELFHLNPFNEYTNDWEKPLFSYGWRPICIANCKTDESLSKLLTFLDMHQMKKRSFEKVAVEVYDYLVRND